MKQLMTWGFWSQLLLVGGGAVNTYLIKFSSNPVGPSRRSGAVDDAAKVTQQTVPTIASGEGCANKACKVEVSTIRHLGSHGGRQ